MARGIVKNDGPDVGPFSFYIEAFYELSTCRSVGMGVGPIPFTSVLEYSRIYDVGDFEEFLYLIRRMDSRYLELERSRQEEKSRNGDDKREKRN